MRRSLLRLSLEQLRYLCMVECGCQTKMEEWNGLFVHGYGSFCSLTILDLRVHRKSNLTRIKTKLCRTIVQTLKYAVLYSVYMSDLIFYDLSFPAFWKCVFFKVCQLNDTLVHNSARSYVLDSLVYIHTKLNMTSGLIKSRNVLKSGRSSAWRNIRTRIACLEDSKVYFPLNFVPYNSSGHVPLIGHLSP